MAILIKLTTRFFRLGLGIDAKNDRKMLNFSQYKHPKVASFGRVASELQNFVLKNKEKYGSVISLCCRYLDSKDRVDVNDYCITKTVHVRVDS